MKENEIKLTMIGGERLIGWQRLCLGFVCMSFSHCSFDWPQMLNSPQLPFYVQGSCVCSTISSKSTLYIFIKSSHGTKQYWNILSVFLWHLSGLLLLLLLKFWFLQKRKWGQTKERAQAVLFNTFRQPNSNRPIIRQNNITTSSAWNKCLFC